MFQTGDTATVPKPTLLGLGHLGHFIVDLQQLAARVALGLEPLHLWLAHPEFFPNVADAQIGGSQFHDLSIWGSTISPVTQTGTPLIHQLPSLFEQS